MAQDHFDAVVVGSGFGGSVAAYRLAEAGRSVAVLERGKPYPPGSFARRPREMAANFWDPRQGLHGLFNVWSFKGIEALVSAGLGGGSLIYANVLLRKDERWFVEDLPGGGTEPWPVSRADLDPHYDAVEAMIGVQRFPFEQPGYGIPKTRALRDAAAANGLEWALPPLAVTFADQGQPPRQAIPIADAAYPNLHGLGRTTCRLCGECDVGCNYGSKNTLDHNYLSAAASLGADLRTRCEVRRIDPRPAGGYSVAYVEHREDAEGRRTDTAKLPRTTITCDQLVLAGGTLGTTHLLLRNRAAFPNLSPALGTRFCGNGDLLGMLLRCRQPGGGNAARTIDASLGPVITSYVRVPDERDGGTGRGFYVEDAGYPIAVDWMVEAGHLPGLARRMAHFAWRRLWQRVTGRPRSDLSAEVSALLGRTELSANSLCLLGMGRDTPDGTMRLNRRGYLDIDWTIATSRQYFERVRDTMRDLGGPLGGRYRDSPLWFLRRVITVHPLGGCPMGASRERGVVDPYGEVYGYPGLFVTDGSVMPGPVGPNPALTIAAFADRAAGRILGEQ